MNWNHMTEGIQHILAKKISITTDPVVKVDIDGEIALETPLEIEIIPNAVQILTINNTVSNNNTTADEEIES